MPNRGGRTTLFPGKARQKPKRSQYDKVYQICRHCAKANVNRPRGLCWACYYTSGVKEQYPSESKYAKRGVGNFSGVAPLPSFPCFCAPGTPEKLAVLEERAKKKQQVFHPADARFEGDPRPAEWFQKYVGMQEGVAA